MFVNVSGTAAYVTTLMNNTAVSSGLTGISTARTASGSGIEVQVTGLASTSINWTVHCDVLGR